MAKGLGYKSRQMGIRNFYALASLLLFFSTTAQAQESMTSSSDPSVSVNSDEIIPPQESHWRGSVGLNISSYDYQEPGVMEMVGMKMGVGLQLSYLQDPVFEDKRWTFDGEFMTGQIDYDGSLSDNRPFAYREDSYYYLLRLLEEHEAPLGDGNNYFGFSYGAGYRHLVTVGSAEEAYTRRQQYYFIPVEMHHRVQLTRLTSLKTILAYDFFLAGRNTSYFAEEDVYLRQDRGEGFGAKLQWDQEVRNFEALSEVYAQLYFHRWNVWTSDTYTTRSTNETLEEPFNYTEQFGLRLGAYF